MKIKSRIKLNLKTDEVISKVESATREGLRDTVVAITADAKKGSPVLTGNNRRSIDYDIKNLVGRVYSTSGYGGYLETGTVKMSARPYFKPALDRNIGGLAGNIRVHLEAKGG